MKRRREGEKTERPRVARVVWLADWPGAGEDARTKCFFSTSWMKAEAPHRL